MKIFRNFGLGLLLLILLAVPLALNLQKALAAPVTGDGAGSSDIGGTVTTDQLDAATYSFTANGTSFPKSIIGVINGQSITFTDSNTGDFKWNYKPTSGPFCDGTVFGGSDGGKGITLKPGGDSTTFTGTINFDYSNPSGDCQNYTNALSFTVNNGSFTASETPASQSGASTTPTCETNDSAGAFSWILCPAFDLMDSVTNVFDGFVEDQLCFNTGQSSTAGPACQGSNDLTDGVHNAWNAFKNIASALLVIVLLVAVISQAIGGGGPLDPYTVRKMLPRIVAAVILMQISWDVAKWMIDLSNDLGRGIADLMSAPFGGTSALNLPTLLGNQFGNIGNVGSGFVLFGAIAAAVVAGVIISIPTLALLGLYVIMALFVAFLVLVFRKMLIILLVILLPIALVLWILPGTEKYWKMWQDNFLKLLMMFPLIMGLITAGRIFAYIVSGSPNGTIFSPHLAFYHLGPVPVPTLGSVSDFTGVILIIAAYFGPYFLLPKTFSWGGAALGAAGKGISNMSERAGKPAVDYLNWRQGLSPWKQARAARKANLEREAKMGFHTNLNQRGDANTIGGAVRGARGRIRRARLAGVEAPGHYRGVRDTILRAGQQQAEAESLKEARDVLEYEVSQALPPGVSHDQYVQDIISANPGDTVHGRVRSEADWRAAAEKAAQYGGTNNAVLEQVHHRANQVDNGGNPVNPELATRWTKFINSSEGTQLMLSKFPMFYKDANYSQTNAAGVITGDIHTTVEQMTPEAFTTAGMDGEQIRTILGQLSQVTAAGGPGAARAQELMESVYITFNQAMTSEATNRRINPAAAEAVRAAVTNDIPSLHRLNAGRGVPGVPEINGAAVQGTIAARAGAGTPAAAYLTDAINNITNEVTPDGRLLR